MALQHARLNDEAPEDLSASAQAAVRKAAETAFDGVRHPPGSSPLDIGARLLRTSDAMQAEVRALLHNRIVNLLADAAATTPANLYEIADPPQTWVNPVQPT